MDEECDDSNTDEQRYLNAIRMAESRLRDAVAIAREKPFVRDNINLGFLEATADRLRHVMLGGEFNDRNINHPTRPKLNLGHSIGSNKKPV